MHHNGLATPLHEAVASLSTEVVSILPAMHSLSGCDTTSKVGTKLQSFIQLINQSINLGFMVSPSKYVSFPYHQIERKELNSLCQSMRC